MRAHNYRGRVLPFLSFIPAAIFSSICVGQALGPAKQVQQLFDNSWKVSDEGYQAAQQLFEQSKAKSPDDRRLPLAMALVAVKNFKNADAQTYLDQAIPNTSSAADPITLTAWRMKIWLQGLKKDDAAAQSSVRTLAGLLNADTPSTDATQTAKWLGGVLGYYSGPASAQNAEAWQTAITNQLKGPLGEALADGKADALKQYQQLQSDQAALRAEMKSKNAAKRADDMKRTEAAEAAAADKLKKLNDPSTKDSSDAKTKKSEAAAQQELQRLQDQGNRLERQLNDEMRKPARNERGIARLRQELTNIQQQVASMNTSGAQPAAAKQGQEAEKKRLQNLQAGLEAKDKRLANSSDDVAATPLDAKISLITTYAPIDLDQEKQRILDSFAGK